METQKSIQHNTEEQVTVFGALADPTRLKLVKLLCRQLEPDALCVNALARLLGVSQSAVSQHLRVLKSIGLVKGERRGYHIHYSIDRRMLEHYRKLVSVALVIKEPETEGPGAEHCPIIRRT
jgi:DNA-binding transcriptional ArsR family regulator